ncbi:MAG TPA: response regulator transcription factor [Candidatus Tenderia electrophaga]|uniref:Response regulator transcription factor n=1 Tax=Candidatus Tenderia electrophaga TaxID=1748243 RepID=A0A832J7Z8_9GAMM|nr:response regulator transcription factor [Candidatus Tenderia electrophaga]
MAREKLAVLFVEDHQALAENLAEFFDNDAYSSDFAADGLTALHLLASNHYDVVVLDVMLPGINGLKICEQIRTQLHSAVPVIMLTALDTIEDKVSGFSAGADDYLAKPFDMRELELRIQALSRRGKGRQERLIADDVIYHPGTLVIETTAGTSTMLSGHSATLFEALIRAYPNFVSYAALSNALWGNTDSDEHTIRTHIYTLRKQLSQAFGRTMIKSLYGRGYQLHPDEK